MPIRSGTSAVSHLGGKDGLTPWEYTLAELLSDAGFATAHYCKWHLGSSQERLPTAQGFDEWYGIPRSSGETAWTIQPGYDPKVYPAEPIMEGPRESRVGRSNRTTTPAGLSSSARLPTGRSNSSRIMAKARSPSSSMFRSRCRMPHRWRITTLHLCPQLGGMRTKRGHGFLGWF